MKRGLLALFCLLALLGAGAAAEPLPVVRGVLFYSPNCGHCHQVINETLPPLLETYGRQLEIMAVNTADEAGRALFEAAIDQYRVPPNRRGVPMLIVGDVVLVGSLEIPQQLPQLIGERLMAGGVSWPALPGLVVPTPAAATAEPAAPAQPEAGTVTVAEPGMGDRFRQDPLGNGIAVLVLLGMVTAVGLALPTLLGQPRPPAIPNGVVTWGIFLLVAAGGLISAYMTYVETSAQPAICGPVGECNLVQQSEYAWLFGVLPLGVVGLAGYGMLGLAWFLGRWGPAGGRPAAQLALGGMALAGTCFSIYLTFLEPFVIGATCAWCLGSALAMTGILLLSLGDTWQVLQARRPVQSGPPLPAR